MKKLEQFYNYLRAREEIRLARLANAPWPWTRDPILQKYKFTNVRRQFDRTSMAFEKHYRKHQDASREIILMNCAIARYFGSSEFYEAIGGWQKEYDPDHLIDVAKKRLKKGEKVFTGAYIITNGGRHGSKVNVIVGRYLDSLWAYRKHLLDIIEATCSWEVTLEALSTVEGFGGSGFMGKEVTLDTMYFDGFWTKSIDGFSRPKDYRHFTPIGPGAERGLVRVIYGKSPRAHRELRSKVFLEHLLDIVDMQGGSWPKGWGELMPTDIQFGLCEFDKYERTRLKEGTPKALYHHEEA